MNKQTEALKMAIEAIENLQKVKGRYNTEIACNRLFGIIQACKDALAETEKDEICSTKQN